MTDLSPKERALIALAEGGDDPSEAARDRMRSNLFAQLGIGAAAAGATAAATTAAKAATAAATGTAGAGASAGATASSAAAGAMKGALGATATGVAVTKATAIKLVLGAVFVTGLSGVGYVVTADAEHIEAPAAADLATPTRGIVDEAIASHSSETTRGDDPPDEAATDDASAEDEPDEPQSTAALPASPRPRASGGPAIGGELGMLQTAQRELRGGDADEALEVLDAHERKYGKGNLGEERMAVRVFALCQAGRAAEARAAAARFLAAHPQSPLASRVARACKP